MERLPDDILLLIFRHLSSASDLPALGRLARTCRRFRALADSNEVWAPVLAQLTPKVVAATPDTGTHRGPETFRRCHVPPHQALPWPGSAHLDSPYPAGTCRLKGHYIRPRSDRTYKCAKRQAARRWRALLLQKPQNGVSRADLERLDRLRWRTLRAIEDLDDHERSVNARRANRGRIAAAFAFLDTQGASG